MKRIVGAALLVLASCASAKAYNGLDLYQDCTGDAAGQLSCSAYSAGFMEAVALLKTISPPGTLPAVCMPARRPSDGFVSWARAHPDELVRDSGEVFAAALFDPAYCHRPGPSVLR